MFPLQPPGSLEVSENDMQAVQVDCPYFPGSSNLVGDFTLINGYQVRMTLCRQSGITRRPQRRFPQAAQQIRAKRRFPLKQRADPVKIESKILPNANQATRTAGSGSRRNPRSTKGLNPSPANKRKEKEQKRPAKPQERGRRTRCGI